MILSSDPIEPIRKTRQVECDLATAFELFTARMGEWWPTSSHSISAAADARIRFEGWVGGRVVEITPDGIEHPWADVISWDPPHRFMLAWHPTQTPVAASILDVRFAPSLTGTMVDLEHRGWEEFGAEQGRALRAEYDPGWDIVLGQVIFSTI